MVVRARFAMGLASGSVSYLRFQVDPPPEAFEQYFCDQLAQHRFSDIDPSTDVEKSVGWVRMDDAFSSDFDPATLVSESGQFLLRLRIDTLKIPAGTLKAYVDEAARARCRQRSLEKLTRKELDQLKLEVKQQLRKRSLPKLQLIEVAWDIGRGEVRLMATSRALADQFVEIFEKTFTTTLYHVGLLRTLAVGGMEQTEIDSLAMLEPERFHLIAG